MTDVMDKLLDSTHSEIKHKTGVSKKTKKSNTQKYEEQQYMKAMRKEYLNSVAGV